MTILGKDIDIRNLQQFQFFDTAAEIVNL